VPEPGKGLGAFLFCEKKEIYVHERTSLVCDLAELSYLTYMKALLW